MKKSNYKCLGCGSDLISDGLYCSPECYEKKLKARIRELEEVIYRGISVSHMIDDERDG